MQVRQPPSRCDPPAYCRDEAFYADTCDCHCYYHCNQGHAERKSCGRWDAFNPDIAQCDHPSNVQLCRTLRQVESWEWKHMVVREHFSAIKWPVTPSNFGFSTPIQIHLLLIDNRTDISFHCPKTSEIMLVPPVFFISWCLETGCDVTSNKNKRLVSSKSVRRF